MIGASFKTRTSEELIALLSAVAIALLAFIIITTLYFGREIFVPISLAILLSFVLAPLVASLERIRVPRGICVTRFDVCGEKCPERRSSWEVGTRTQTPTLWKGCEKAQRPI